jgi:RimJ/RimL family protein N-acetyltransferase
VELKPLTDSHDDLVLALQRQDDVWEFLGTLPIPAQGQGHYLFAIMEGEVSLGFAGLVKSQVGDDFELMCAIRSEVQQHGIAKETCRVLLQWAFGTAKLDRVIARIPEGNEAARAIALKLGLTELAAGAGGVTVYVKYRDEGSLSRA